MKIRHLSLPLALALCACASSHAQSVNTSQQITLQGLRSAAAHGSFLAAAYAPDGSLFLLLDEHDGLRLLKTDATATTVLAQAQAGAAGDSGVSMVLDANGNVYVTGTTTSTSLNGTSGSAFPSRADTSTNSFLAKYDNNLNQIFLTFLGAGRTAAASVYATADAVFVTGITFNPAFPVTPAGIQQTPATGSSENGFVERFTTDGSALVYATYLTGAKGDTVPSAIVADSADNAYITGTTSASGFPTISALQPTILGVNSGFLAKLNASGSSFTFSTFLAGTGLNSMAIDSSTNSLLLTGNIAFGQFPIATVTTPLTSSNYQTLLRIPLNGQSLTSSVLLVPGSQSFVSAGANGTAWISGALTTPLFPGTTPPDYTAGDSFLLHLTAANTFDQTLRFGGISANDASYSSLTSSVAAPAVNAAGSAVMLPGTITATIGSSFLPTQRFDLPFVATPNSVLPSTVRDIIPTAASCGTSSQCTGTAALLSSISTAPQTTTSLGLSADDLPNLILRNMGSSTASGISLSVSGYTMGNNCGPTLAPSNQCNIALTGSGPGSITISATNAPSSTIALPSNTLTPNAIVLSTDELDFGIVSSVTGIATQTITVSNLSSTNQIFSSAKDGGATTPYSFSESATDCPSGGATGVHALLANSSCHITLGLTASTSSTNDGPAHTTWKIGPHDVILTGFTQAAALNISATEIDFGTQFFGATTLNLPRYLYISNNSDIAVPHTIVTIPSSSPFSLTDNCPISLQPHTVCQIKLTYLSSLAPSADSTTLTLDAGSSVLLTGTTLPPASVSGSSANPTLNVSATSLTFATPVVVTGLSSAVQTLTLKNTGSSAFNLSLAIEGDFLLSNACPISLAGGASCTVQLTFSPSQPGARSGLLSITAGTGFNPTYIALAGTGAAILPPNNGTLNLGQTLVGEPLVVWYKVQQSLTSLTATTGSPQFGVALVQDTGTGHGTLPTSSFTQTTTSACSNCWLGVQFLSPSAASQSTSLSLSTAASGNPYKLTVTATSLAVQGLLLTPITQDFGSVAINSSSPAILFTLANLLTSSAGVTVQSVSTTGDFTVAANTSGGTSCIGSLASTASCFVQVVFSPTSTGDRGGTLTIATSAGTATSSLTGYGVSDPGIAINPSALSFSNIPGTAAVQQAVTLSNTSASTLILGSPTVSDPSFAVTSGCTVLAPGNLCTLTVIFTPQSAPVAGVLSFSVTTTVNGQTTTTTYSVPLSGAYTSVDAGLQIVAGQVNLGSAGTGAVGTTREFLLNNLSGKALNVTLSMPRQFPLSSPSPCPTLAIGGSCSFSVSLLPSTGGALTGSVFAFGTPTDGSAGVQALTYLLGYGTATGKLTITGGLIPNSPLNFGLVTSGQTIQQTLTLTNTGSGNLTIHRITSQAPFLSTSNCGVVLTMSASCTVVLTYAPSYEVLSTAPSTARNDAGMLLIESDAISSPDALSLTGAAAPVVSSSPVSSSVLAAFQLSQSSLTFANTQIGNASDPQTVTLTNTGTTTLHVLSLITSTDFAATTTCAMLLPGAACNLSVRLTPTTASTSTVRSGTVEILSDAGTSLEFISLIGASSAAPLTISPSALDFGTVNVGASGALSVTVTNTSGSPVSFTGVSATSGFSTTRGTCPIDGTTLAAGSTCALNVIFQPSATGVRTGTLSLSSNATQLPLTVTLTGIAVAAQLSVTPGALVFGSIAVGAQASMTLTLLNNGTASVTAISNSLSGTNSADFAVTSPCSTTTLAPNQGCTETITFTPASSGPRSATLHIASSDPNSPALVAITGTGAQVGSFTLTVNGSNAASMTVKSGSPAVFPLSLTPSNGYTGAVALTCAPITPGLYASCSLLASTLTLAGAPQSSTATINTVTSAMVQSVIGLSGLLLCPLMLRHRRRRRRVVVFALLLVSCILGGISMVGCGSSSQSGNLRYTPAGTYQYQVTASSTSGAVVSSTVTLNLIVQ